MTIGCTNNRFDMTINSEVCLQAKSCTSVVCESCFESKIYFKEQYDMDNFTSYLSLSENAKRAWCHLYKSLNKLCSHEDLVCFVWECQPVGHSSLAVVIFELRSFVKNQKMKIISVRGKGYILIPTLEYQK